MESANSKIPIESVRRMGSRIGNFLVAAFVLLFIVAIEQTVEWVQQFPIGTKCFAGIKQPLFKSLGDADEWIKHSSVDDKHGYREMEESIRVVWIDKDVELLVIDGQLHQTFDSLRREIQNEKNNTISPFWKEVRVLNSPWEGTRGWTNRGFLTSNKPHVGPPLKIPEFR